jgi:hypothetical protein
VSFDAPDKAVILKVLVQLQGFENDMLVAKKIQTSFDLAADLFSNGKHYDFGMGKIICVNKIACHKLPEFYCCVAKSLVGDSQSCTIFHTQQQVVSLKSGMYPQSSTPAGVFILFF